jgi:hypothetical protein
MWLAGFGEIRNAYRIFVVKPRNKRPLVRRRRRWEDNIKMDILMEMVVMIKLHETSLESSTVAEFWYKWFDRSDSIKTVN